MFLRRFLPFLLVAGLSVFFLLAVFQNRTASTWRRLPQAVGLGDYYTFPGEQGEGPTEEQIASGENILPDMRDGDEGREWQHFHEPNVENTSPYPKGETKPPGSNYTKALVVPKLRRENTSWIEEELGDLIEVGLLKPAVYVVDDPKAELHPPKNKGHEVMVYLTYIIDHYDELADVNMFMHAHREAWHNNDILGNDAVEMIRRLSPERVTREGYMNLRCHWDPGCPAWLHPGSTKKNNNKKEEILLAQAWSQLFPLDPIPNILAQPCCAQFAVSRERIQRTSKMRFIVMRDWILRTQLSDYLSGRVFEYIWQFIFDATPIHCPSMSWCYCDGYGMCFGGPKEFDKWFELRFKRNELKEHLRQWQEKADLIADWREHDKDGKLAEEAMLEVPEVGRDAKLKAMIKELDDDLEERKRKAMERGKDPKQRALESGREWKEGDGF